MAILYEDELALNAAGIKDVYYLQGYEVNPRNRANQVAQFVLDAYMSLELALKLKSEDAKEMHFGTFVVSLEEAKELEEKILERRSENTDFIDILHNDIVLLDLIRSQLEKWIQIDKEKRQIWELHNVAEKSELSYIHLIVLRYMYLLIPNSRDQIKREITRTIIAKNSRA